MNKIEKPALYIDNSEETGDKEVFECLITGPKAETGEVPVNHGEWESYMMDNELFEVTPENEKKLNEICDFLNKNNLSKL